MTDIEKIFIQDDDTFTIFVVAQKFVVGKGHEYFHSFINKSNYIVSDEQIKERFFNALKMIEANVAPVSKLVKIFSSFSIVSIPEAITSLCKIFTVHEHQVAGPNVIDPIILQEGKITKKAITQLINLNKDSILRPTIIILLKDNNFERARELLGECPDGINVKMIDGGGMETIYKVINCGADDIDSFINSFSDQCYSTCSKTKREILLNNEWSDNSIVKKYSPILMKIRTNLLFDHKELVGTELANLADELSNLHIYDSRNEKILRSFECIVKLFRVFCNDYGGQDILDAYRLAEDINNDVLKAQTYRFAEFLPNTTDEERKNLYTKGTEIFKNNSMIDHAIYCKNNMLIEQFYSDYVDPEAFRDLQCEAVNNVPGMVGLSHIYNNVGVAYLYCGDAQMAIEFFEKGLDYARYQDRIVQNLALESNKMIAERYMYASVNENRIRLLMKRIFAGMGIHKLPFLAADYMLNVLSVAYAQNPQLGLELIHSFPIVDLLNRSFSANIMGSKERFLQLQYLNSHYTETFPLLNLCHIPPILSETAGKRLEFVLQYGFTPVEFNTWL